MIQRIPNIFSHHAWSWRKLAGGAESYLAHQRRVGINKPNSGVTALAHQHGSAGEQ